jgi:DNA-binding MarR family transcriptional regulator
MTNRIDRLETKGLVERLPDPNDGRGVLVKLTAAGKKAVDLALTDLLERERLLLDEVTAAQREVLVRVLREIVAPLDLGNDTSDE